MLFRSLVGVDTGAVAAAVAEPLREAGIPVVSCFFGPSAGDRGRRVMLENGIPSFAWPEQTVVALRRMLTLESHSEAFSLTPPALTRMEAVRDMLHGEGYLSQTACERLLSEFGLPVARSQLVSSAEACRDISLRYPVVAKIEQSRYQRRCLRGTRSRHGQTFGRQTARNDGTDQGSHQ